MENNNNEVFINPYTDFGFKKLFGTEPNKDLLISFLNALFDGDQKTIVDLKYLNTEVLGPYYGGHTTRSGVRSDGRLVDITMPSPT